MHSNMLVNAEFRSVLYKHLPWSGYSKKLQASFRNGSGYSSDLINAVLIS